MTDPPEGSGPFDAYYFAHGCGRPYQRDDEWLAFFGSIADRIVSDIQPRTVLDAGCAMGFLVEELRNRGVEAYGVDVSEYAIERVHPSVKPYCWRGSVTEELSQRYDLIVCIEVLEHMQAAEAEQAVANLCQHADDVLFSSTPFDYKEATHINVQPPEYWAELFARHGFIHDLEFDASFITAWTARFRQKDKILHRIVRDYERRLWLLWREKTEIRGLGLEMRNQLAEADRLVSELQSRLETGDTEISALHRQLEEADQRIAGIQGKLDEGGRQAALLSRKLEESKELGLSHQQQSAEKDRHIAGLQEKIRDRESQLTSSLSIVQENERLRGQLAAIEAGVSWRLLSKIRQWRTRFFRPGSRQGGWWEASAGFFRTWLDSGFRAAISKTITGLLGHTKPGAPRTPYELWQAEYEPKSAELARQRSAAKGLAYQPLISIITPVYNPSAKILRETIDSVRSQTYANWEWCLADASSEGSEARRVLKHSARVEARLRVEALERNLGIAGNSNRALEMAKGELVVLLDHDDLLAPNALFEIVRVLNEDPSIDLIYFDEDKLSADGHLRHEPWFKPDFSPELLLSANYLMHSVVRSSLIQAVGGFDTAADGAQDWDLLLRCVERTVNIRHIPKVLYHWRQVEGSAASELLAKPWVFENQLRSVQGHLKRRGIREARAYFQSPGFLRVSWPVSGVSLVSIIIPTRDKVDLLRKCLESISSRTAYDRFEILLVDNGSLEARTHAYYEDLARDGKVRVIPFPGEFNFSAANNLGANQAAGDILLFLNNDTEVLEPDWLEEMIRWTERPEIGVVGAKLLHPTGKIQHSGVIIGMEGHASHVFWGSLEKQSGPFGSVDWYRDYMAVTGACMMVRRSTFEEVGGFDEGYSLAFSDVEFCLRIRGRGFRVLYNPYVRLRHYEGQSRGDFIPVGDLRRGYEHMHALVETGDPYYNPNLSYNHRIPAILMPWEESRTDRLNRIVRMHEAGSIGAPPDEWARRDDQTHDGQEADHRDQIINRGAEDPDERGTARRELQRGAHQVRRLLKRLPVGRGGVDVSSSSSASSCPEENQMVWIPGRYIMSAPDAQNSVDIFKGEWASKLPSTLTDIEAGSIPLFEDPRIEWAIAQIGGVEGRTVLELGPLEGGHTYMLHSHGAESIIAIEASTHAFLKCLVIKELLGMDRAHFRCGDLVEFLRAGPPEFDICLASGVLYHMRNPAEVIRLISLVSDRVIIWTHYYDAGIIMNTPALRGKFTSETASECEGFDYRLYRYEYQGAQTLPGFCGGADAYSNWMTRTDIVSCLKYFGYTDLREGFEHPDHPNGPAFAVVAQRESKARHS